MRLKLFEVEQAISEYEELLEHNDENPGFLSPTAIGVVQRKIADARQLLSMMDTTQQQAAAAGDAGGANGGSSSLPDSVSSFWRSLFANDDDGPTSFETGCCTGRTSKGGAPRAPPPSFAQERSVFEQSGDAVANAASSLGQSSRNLLSGASESTTGVLQWTRSLLGGQQAGAPAAS
jgi:hypothetical protein